MGRRFAEWRWLAPFLAVCAILLLAAGSAGRAHGIEPGEIIFGYAIRIVRIAPFVIFFGIVAYYLLCGLRREASPIAATAALVRNRFPTAGSLGAALTAVACMPVLMGAYGLLKMLMPATHPFAWDDALARLDRLLFLGVDPWRITHALFGAPLPSAIIDMLYTLWVPLLLAATLFAAMARPELRARYFLSFALGWMLIGIGGAYLLSSAGPCYAAHIGSETAPWFEPLMEKLRDNGEYRLGAVHWQAMLWNAHATESYGFAMGISAAPSMHNAVCMLYVLALSDSRPLWRILSRLFAAIIFVGSIHTGWHYAVDGLIGWAAMAAVWWAVGRYLRFSGYSAPERESAAEQAPGFAEPAPVGLSSSEA